MTLNGNCTTDTGLLVFEAGNVTLLGNAVSGSQTGVAVETWCWFAPSANNNKVVMNTIEDADWGVSVAAYALGGYSTCDPSANNNKVVNNSITATEGDTGVFLGTGSFWGGSGYTPSADNNKVIRNQISGYTTPIDDGGTRTKVRANVPSTP